MKVLHYNSPEWTNKNIISSFLESGFLVVNFPFVDVKETLNHTKEKLKLEVGELEKTEDGYNFLLSNKCNDAGCNELGVFKVVLKKCDVLRDRFLKIGCEILYAIEEFLDVYPNSITMKHSDADNALRFIKYYKDQKGPIRIGEHCDFGTLTLVHVFEPVEEYEIFYDNSWKIIKHPSDDFLIVNIGDFMQIWSDDKLKSTPHRIMNRTKKERHSFVMFMDVGNHVINGIDHAAWNEERRKKAHSGMTYYHKNVGMNFPG